MPDQAGRKKAMKRKIAVHYQIASYLPNAYRIWDDEKKDFVDCSLRLYHTRFQTFDDAKKTADEIRDAYRKNGWKEAADSVAIEGIEVYTDF